MRIRISVLDITLVAELIDNVTSRQIWAALPIESEVNTWGDEIYFEVPVKVPVAADAHVDVEVGTVAYWPAGPALCLFFGPTPVSTGKAPRAASPVNVCGKVRGDVTVLKRVKDGSVIRVERCEPGVAY